jgi:hypothetical protein
MLISKPPFSRLAEPPDVPTVPLVARPAIPHVEVPRGAPNEWHTRPLCRHVPALDSSPCATSWWLQLGDLSSHNETNPARVLAVLAVSRCVRTSYSVYERCTPRALDMAIPRTMSLKSNAGGRHAGCSQARDTRKR